MQSQLNESEDEEWLQIAPLLDMAIARLDEKDRHAIVLRFFQNKSLSEIGSALGASEDGARMRVNRALEKLRRFFGKRGIASTTAIIAGAISANSVQAAPAALAKSVAAVAVAKGATASSSTVILIKGALKIVAWTKSKNGGGRWSGGSFDRWHNDRYYSRVPQPPLLSTRSCRARWKRNTQVIRAVRRTKAQRLFWKPLAGKIGRKSPSFCHKKFVILLVAKPGMNMPDCKSSVWANHLPAGSMATKLTASLCLSKSGLRMVKSRHRNCISNATKSTNLINSGLWTAVYDSSLLRRQI